MESHTQYYTVGSEKKALHLGCHHQKGTLNCKIFLYLDEASPQLSRLKITDNGSIGMC